MEKVTYTELAASKFDAGIFRTYLWQNYGHALTFGSSPKGYFRAIRLCKKLAKITGVPVEVVIENVRVDYLTSDLDDSLVMGAGQ